MSYSPDIAEFPDRSITEKRTRIPPHQRQVGGFPTLSINSTPFFDGNNWSFTVDGLVKNPTTWTWDQLLNLPKTTITADFHCVTGWSRLDLQWAGVSMLTINEIVQPLSNAHYITSFGPEEYTSSLPYHDYMDEDDVLIA